MIGGILDLRELHGRRCHAAPHQHGQRGRRPAAARAAGRGDRQPPYPRAAVAGRAGEYRRRAVHQASGPGAGGAARAIWTPSTSPPWPRRPGSCPTPPPWKNSWTPSASGAAISPWWWTNMARCRAWSRWKISWRKSSATFPTSMRRETRPDVRRRPDGSYLVDGTVPVRDLNRELDWNLPDDDATTIAGLVIQEPRTIPEPASASPFSATTSKSAPPAQPDHGAAHRAAVRWRMAAASVGRLGRRERRQRQGVQAGLRIRRPARHRRGAGAPPATGPRTRPTPCGHGNGFRPAAIVARGPAWPAWRALSSTHLQRLGRESGGQFVLDGVGDAS